jgi:hypothetical protein
LVFCHHKNNHSRQRKRPGEAGPFSLPQRRLALLLVLLGRLVLLVAVRLLLVLLTLLLTELLAGLRLVLVLLLLAALLALVVLVIRHGS